MGPRGQSSGPSTRLPSEYPSTSCLTDRAEPSQVSYEPPAEPQNHAKFIAERLTEPVKIEVTEPKSARSPSIVDLDQRIVAPPKAKKPKTESVFDRLTRSNT